jgi:hypothetical protein
MPKALYPTRRQKSATVSGTGVHSGPAPHLKDHLLCFDCEQRFEQNGETEVLKWLAPKTRDYSLNEKLRLALPREAHPEISLFSAYELGLDAAKFAYFALSIVWRGAVHRWTLLDGTLTKLLELGAHEETIRQFLVGESTFPHQIVFVVVIVCSDSESRSLWTLPGQDEMDGCENYRFLARGVLFRVLVGSDIPEFYRRSSCVAARQAIAYGDCAHRVKEDFATLLQAPVE